MLFVVLALVSFGLVLTMNALTIWLSFAGLALARVYPFMKRYTHLPQVVLGAAFGWAIPMGWAAVSDSVPLNARCCFSPTFAGRWPTIPSTPWLTATTI